MPGLFYNEQLSCPRVPENASFATCAAAAVPCVKCAYECTTCNMPLDTDSAARGHAAITEHALFRDRAGRLHQYVTVRKLKLVAVDGEEEVT